jgi:hypothetical protein
MVKPKSAPVRFGQRGPQLHPLSGATQPVPALGTIRVAEPIGGYTRISDSRGCWG